MEKDNLFNDENRFISKWIFVLPSAIKNTSKIFNWASSISENKQQTMGFKLSIWKPK